MDSIPEQARAAMVAIAETVTDAPPLALPPSSAPARRRRAWWPWMAAGPDRHRRLARARWLAPLAAAVAVIVIAAGLAIAHRAGMPTAPAQPPVSPGGVPPYYVALSQPPDTATPNVAIVGDARTGQVLARVSPPAGTTFAGVAGAADDETFVLDSQPFPQPLPTVPAQANISGYFPSGQATVLPRTWYLLRIAPGSGTAPVLTRLAVPVTPRGDLVTGIALSPDGSKLALSVQQDALSQGYRQSLRVYAVASGALLGTWTTGRTEINSYDYGVDGNSAVTWLADGVHVAFYIFGPYLRMVDIRQPGRDLVRDSTALAGGHELGCNPGTHGPGGTGMARLSPDGSAIACIYGFELNPYDHGGPSPPSRSAYCSHTGAQLSLSVMSAVSQKLITTLGSYQEQGHCVNMWESPQITWTSANGSELIAFLPYPGHGWVIYGKGTLTPLHVTGASDPHYIAW